MANIGWNTAIIKDRAREMGINLSDQQASDILGKTFVQSMYGADPNKVISILQSMKGGGGSGSSSGSFSTGVSSPPSQTTTDWTQVYQNIVSQLKNTWQMPNTNDLSNLSSQINPEQMKQSRLDLIPLVENIYDKLSEKLSKKYEKEKQRVETEKKWEQGKQSQAAASAGFSSSEGFDAMLVRNIGKAYNQKIEDLSDQEGIDQEKLSAEKLKSVKEIQAEANDAALKGYTLLADINYKIASLKQQQDSIISQAAKDILNAKTEEEKLNWTKYYQQSLIDLQNKELDLTAQKVKKELELQERELGIKEKSLLQKDTESELDEKIKFDKYITDRLNQLNIKSKEDALNVAVNVLNAVDKNKDKMLSQSEYQAALSLYLNKVKDPVVAKALLSEAFEGYGFKKWKW